MQDNSDLIIRDCCEAEAAEFGKPDTICITVDVLREIVQRHFPGTCLHQIQEPAAAEQAAWHAGLDEGRAQAARPVVVPDDMSSTEANTKYGESYGVDWVYEGKTAAPAAVTVPDLQDMLRELRVQIHKITVHLAPTSDCSGVWMAHDKMSAALAATPAAAPVVLPEPDFHVRPASAVQPHRALMIWDNDATSEPAYFARTVRALLATATGLPAQAVPVANCYSNDEGDTWSDRPDDCDFVDGRTLGEEFELKASIRAWPEVFRVTKVPDETSDDYEVEPVSIRTSAAPLVQAVPDGCKLVPVDLTPEMKREFMDLLMDGIDIYVNSRDQIEIQTDAPRRIWKAVLALSPAAPAHPAEGVQAAQYLPLLLRDIARDLEITVHEACATLKPLGNFSVNSAVTAEMASKLRELFPAVAAPAAGVPAKAAEQEQPIALLRIGKSGFGVDVERWAIGELGNGNHPLFAYVSPKSQADARDAELLGFLQDQCIDLRCFTTSDGEDVGWRTVQHHMSEPRERVVSEVYGDQPRRAIREAMARIERDPYCTGPLHLEDDAAIAAAKGE